MAVNRNPYRRWEELRRSSDYRSTDTQVTSLVRQQLSQSEYLRNSNRVNPGPRRLARIATATGTTQIPHVFGSEDMWGWQSWATQSVGNMVVTGLATSLFEISSSVPGASYFPYSNVGGATYIDSVMAGWGASDVDLESSSVTESRLVTYINNIPVDTSELGPASLNYLMVYSPNSNSFVFKSPSYVLGISDGDLDAESINFGTY